MILSSRSLPFPMTITVLTLDEIAPSPALQAAWLAELPAARRAQLEGWPDSDARRRSLLGSRLLRDGLLRMGYPADSLVSLRYAEHGKPTLDLPLDFSLAHCAGRILCAISTRGPIGVDIEPVGELTAAEFRIYLSARERAWAGADARRFYALWTRKEAVVKAAGTLGLAHLRDVRIEQDQATFAGLRWHTAPVPVESGYSAHVAHAHPLSALVVQRVTEASLFAA